MAGGMHGRGCAWQRGHVWQEGVWQAGMHGGGVHVGDMCGGGGGGGGHVWWWWGHVWGNA